MSAPTSVGAVVAVIARALTDRPDQVTVVETERRTGIVVELTVAPGEHGRVIGRQGRTVAALRTLASLAAEKDGKTASVEVRD